MTQLRNIVCLFLKHPFATRMQTESYKQLQKRKERKVKERKLMRKYISTYYIYEKTS